MPFDEEPDDDPGRRGPLPPDDRIWRHPSELGSGTPVGPPPAMPISGGGAAGRTWGLAVGSALVGGVLTLGALAGMGMLGDRIPRAVEQVSVSVPRNAEAPETAVGVQAYEAVARVVATGSGGAVNRGTAIVFRSDGYLLTTADVVEGSDSIEVTMADGTTRAAELVGTDDPNDVAVVRVDAADLPTATLATDSQVELTDRVIALSTDDSWPAGREVRVGVVSGLRQRITDGADVLHGMVQANVDLGGPPPGTALLSTYGAVVGIVTGRGLAAGSPGAGPSGANDLDVHHATPIDWAKHLADQIVAGGRTTYVWVGIEGVDASEEEMGGARSRGGAKVRRIMDGSPADVADLQEGDVVTAVDGQPVLSMSDLVVWLRIHEPGYVASIELLRAGEEKLAAVRLTDRP